MDEECHEEVCELWFCRSPVSHRSLGQFAYRSRCVTDNLLFCHVGFLSKENLSRS